MQRLYRQAAEEAADEAAAVVVGGVDVAAAVVEVSRVRLRLQRQALLGLPAIDGGDLTARIERLLATEPRARRSGAPVVVATLLLASLAVAPFFRPPQPLRFHASVSPRGSDSLCIYDRP
jgi:hypothetical protein